MESMQNIVEAVKTELDQIHQLPGLNECKSKYLGRKGIIQEMMQKMKDLSLEERPVFGQKVNQAKAAIEALFDASKARIEAKNVKEQLDKERIDVTLPGRKMDLGAKHILTQVIEQVEDLFIGMGYTIEEGPEVETDLYNFEMLNLPKGHPARDMQDSFFITEELLLRTHTSPVQVRTLLGNRQQSPLKIICPGKVYRKDDDDQTHSHQFTQIEGLVVDDKTTLADLKGTLLVLARTLFGEDREIRLRPSFFPFTEPSVEVDVSCHRCNGKGCSLCKQTGWIEILGAGMVNNAVLTQAGYDPQKFQGFAFGMGVERIAMLKYGIDDIRMFFTNDLRFNRQFL
jgi:phenylalanyl-tRNA synthetase alpha chain